MRDGERRVSPGIHLQDYVAFIISLGFLALLVWTVSHLARGIAEINANASRAAYEFKELLDKAKSNELSSSSITAWESEISDGERTKDRIIAQRDLAQKQLAHTKQSLSNTEMEIRKTESQAGEKGLGGGYPWNPGQEPDLYFKAWRTEWNIWNAKKTAADLLNSQYQEHQKSIAAIMTAMNATESKLKDIAREYESIEANIRRMRDLKNKAIEVMRDPAKLRELDEMARGSTFAKAMVVVVHVPLVIYCFAYFMKYAFRLCLMREWLGVKRLKS